VLHPLIHKNPDNFIFNNIGKFFDPKEINIDMEEINKHNHDKQKINTLNNKQMKLINKMIEAELDDSVIPGLTYEEDKFMPN
jgi:hypothetical protein